MFTIFKTKLALLDMYITHDFLKKHSLSFNRVDKHFERCFMQLHIPSKYFQNTQSTPYSVSSLETMSYTFMLRLYKIIVILHNKKLL